MTKSELDNLITKNIDYIYSKIEQVSKNSPFPSVYLNDCSDVISELYIVLSKQKNIDKMQTECHLRGMVNNVLVMLLRKKGSVYIRNIYDEKTNSANIDNNLDIYEHEDEDEYEYMSIDKQTFDYAVSSWNELGKPSDCKLYKLYFLDGFNSVRKLADRLEISNYASYMMIGTMIGTIKDICFGLSYAEARENNE